MKLGKSVFFFILIILTLSSFPMKANGESDVIDELNHIADEVLQLVRSSRYEEADRLLQHFSRQFLTDGMAGHIFSMDEVRIVTIAHDEAVKAVNDESAEHHDRVDAAIKFRLVVDAVSSTGEPLWTEMEEHILSVFGGVKEAAYAGDNGDFHSKFNKLLRLYDVIYPSINFIWSLNGCKSWMPG